MKHVSLATRYRPQLFSEVAGQDLIKTVLSRASAEDRVAAGYLLSGTRGVGKTTIARIFAKALNCEKAPCAEPCNECDSCRRVTQGTHPDVIEMDGASNNSVEDARNLRENVGFAPMEGRYKVFIIDEAHMLSRQAFNALLKTLEEPPPHVVFIFATTEIHKFLPTILSRCQVFSFRHLNEDTITAHLAKVLGQEKMAFEDAALRLIARRAAGSARDSMSLLDQVLAYGDGTLTADTVRTVLGLAGLDALGKLFDALAAHDCGQAALFCRELVSREIDIGFFLRELTDHFRSLFLMGQCGRDSVARLGVPGSELDFLEEHAKRFSQPYLHAAWQMILNSQRGISQSQEPAAALELMLVNLALLPQLLPSGLVKDTAVAGSASTGIAPGPKTGAGAPSPAAAQPAGAPVAPAQTQKPQGGEQRSVTAPTPGTPYGAASRRAPGPAPRAEASRPAPTAAAPKEESKAEPAPATSPAPGSEAVEKPAFAGGVPLQAPAAQPAPAASASEPSHDDEGGYGDEHADDADDADEYAMGADFQPVFDWAAFVESLANTPDAPPAYLVKSLRFVGKLGSTIRLECDNESQMSQVAKVKPALVACLSRYCSGSVAAEIVLSEKARNNGQLQGAPPVLDRPELRHCFELLGAHVERVQRR